MKTNKELAKSFTSILQFTPYLGSPNFVIFSPLHMLKILNLKRWEQCTGDPETGASYYDSCMFHLKTLEFWSQSSQMHKNKQTKKNGLPRNFCFKGQTKKQG